MTEHKQEIPGTKFLSYNQFHKPGIRHRAARIYVAGPLNALAVAYIHNCHRMMQNAEALRGRGYSVYVPCMDLLLGLKFGYDSYEDYFENSQPWLDAADAVYLGAGWKASSGCLRERDRAVDHNIPCFESMADLFASVPLIIEEKIVPRTKKK